MSRAPFDNVFLHAILAADPSHGDLVAARSPAGELRGLAYLGPQFVFAGPDPQVAAAFVPAVLERPRPRMVVAPRPHVEAFCAAIGTRLRAPAVVRTSQPVLALRRGELRTHAHDLDVARATRNEAPELTREANEMTWAELGKPAAPLDVLYRERIARLIEAGEFWRARRDGRLVFQLFLGPQSRFTAQLQGVWSPPGARGRGDATRAMSAICEALLREHPALSLYVNDFNAPALALYERLGFTRAGEFQSLIY